MPAQFKRDLWSLVLDSVTIDRADLLHAIDEECQNTDVDFRTRLLIRDSLKAISSNAEETLARLSPGSRQKARLILSEPLGELKFPSLLRRILDHTRPDKVLSFLRELSTACHSPTRMDVGGSSALILRDLLQRFTEDIDAVDEIPASLRNQHTFLDQLSERYGLRLAHFQSHYLPQGYEARIQSLGVFGQLTVFLVDPVDIFVGKLFSSRTKDLDDCRMLKPLLGWPTILDRLRTSSGPLRSEEKFRKAAEHNWYVLTGEPLPACATD